MLESPFNKVVGLRLTTLSKRDSNTGAFLRAWQIFKNTFFCETPKLAASGHE